jgi:hypothetical protein
VRRCGRGARARARSHCRFVPPFIHFIPNSLSYSVPLYLKRQCDRTLGAGSFEDAQQARLMLIKGGPALATPFQAKPALPRPHRSVHQGMRDEALTPLRAALWALTSGRRGGGAALIFPPPARPQKLELEAERLDRIKVLVAVVKVPPPPPPRPPSRRWPRGERYRG